MEEGIKAGRDLMENRQASGRLHSHWGVFAPWDVRSEVTRVRSSVNRSFPLAVLYVPIIDNVRAGGRITESGIIVCSNPIPFRFVKEVWLCVPSDRRR